MILIEDIIDSEDELMRLANLAKVDSYSNFNKFEKRIPDYLNYHIAKYEGRVVAMSGMFQSKQWDKKFVRIADRTYYFKEARSGSLSYLNPGELRAIASTHFLPLHVKIALEKDLVPFFSITGIKRRAAIIKVIERWNNNKENKHKFKLLPEMYYTCNHNISTNENPACWQNVAILDIKGHEIFELPSRPLNEF